MSTKEENKDDGSIEQFKAELEKLKLENELNNLKNGNGSSTFSGNASEQERNKLKTYAIWSIFGWILFVIPGFIFWILTIIKTAQFKVSKENESFKLATLILLVLIWPVGSIMAIVLSEKE